MIVYNPDFIPEPYWVEVNSQYPRVRCVSCLQLSMFINGVLFRYVKLPGPTRGAAETVLFGLKGLEAAELNRPTMLIDGRL